MSENWELILRATVIGVGATAISDLWSVFLKRFFGVPPLNYGMVGRWFGHIPRGRLVHDTIAKAPPVAGEQVIGWGSHYLIGVVFAAALLAIWGLDWGRQPTPIPAITVGIATIVAPFFIMQPGMGAGIAASRTPNPTVSRLRSLIFHTVFGLGLYLSALLAAQLIRVA